MVFFALIFTNILIAVIGDVVEEVTETGEAWRRFVKAKFLVDYCEAGGHIDKLAHVCQTGHALVSTKTGQLVCVFAGGIEHLLASRCNRTTTPKSGCCGLIRLMDRWSCARSTPINRRARMAPWLKWKSGTAGSRRSSRRSTATPRLSPRRCEAISTLSSARRRQVEAARLPTGRACIGVASRIHTNNRVLITSEVPLMVAIKIASWVNISYRPMLIAWRTPHVNNGGTVRARVPLPCPDTCRQVLGCTRPCTRVLLEA